MSAECRGKKKGRELALGSGQKRKKRQIKTNKE